MAYSRHLEVAQDTSCLASHDTSVANLGWSCVAVHLRELKLGFGANSGREGGVTDDVAERLPINKDSELIQSCCQVCQSCVSIIWRPPVCEGLVGLRHTVQPRALRRPCALCDRGSSWP